MALGRFYTKPPCWPSVSRPGPASSRTRAVLESPDPDHSRSRQAFDRGTLSVESRHCALRRRKQRVESRSLRCLDSRNTDTLSDIDGDGISDDKDVCPNSVLSATVVIDDCDSGVPNTLLPIGCTISDLIAECAAGAKNHGNFVSCASHLTNDLKKDGIKSGEEKGKIQMCAAKAEIP